MYYVYLMFLRRLSKALRTMFPDNRSLIKAKVKISTILKIYKCFQSQVLLKVATKKELRLMEKQGDLGRVWWIPISWSMSMVKR